MSWVSSEFIAVLTFLLPGLVASKIFYSLTAHPKPSQFDLIVKALIFTTVVQTVVSTIPWTENGEIVPALVVAVFLALIAVFFSNNDFPHGLLRRIRFTKETSYPSEWYPAFARNSKCYVVLHLKGERRLYGWPDEWPSRPGEGHFRITEPEWLTEEENRPSAGVEEVLLSVDQVEMVEFLRMESSDRTKE